MSVPEEKRRAVQYAGEWLSDLTNVHYRPKTGEVRGKACRLLRHFPWKYDVENFKDRRHRTSLNEAYEWLMSLLDRRYKILMRPTRAKARELLDWWPDERAMDEAMSQWR